MAQNITKKGNKWYCLIQFEEVKYTPKHGFTNYRDAQKWISEKKSELLQGIKIKQTGMTVEGLCRYWLDNYAAFHLNELSYDHHECAIRLHIVPILGAIKIINLSKADVGLLQRRAQESVSANRAYDVSVLFRSILKRAEEEWEFIYRNPARGVTLPKKQQRTMEILEYDELMHLRDIADEQSKRIISLAGLCAIRRGEVFGLEWHHFNFRDNTIDIRQQMRKGVIVEFTKTEAARRTVPMWGDIIELMKTWKLQCGTPYPWGNKGGRMSPEVWCNKVLPKLLKTAGISKNITLHTLRHSCVTYLLRRGTPLPVIQKIVGHKNFKTTVDIYGHLADQDVLEGFERLEQFHYEETWKDSPKSKNI